MPFGRPRVYLAYGSNLHPQRLEARIGSVEWLGNAKLPGWSLRFDKRGGDGSAKANLHARPGSEHCVLAAAYALSADQVSRLDIFEGCGSGYETFPVTVRLNGEAVHAFTYLAPSHWLSGALLPFDWYVELILAGARFHRFDEYYVQQIERQPTKKDPDCERARAILKSMHLPLLPHYRR